MKSLIVMLFFLGFTTIYSQEKKENGSAEGSMKLEELPEVVIKAAKKDFSVYLPLKNPDANIKRLQNTFVAYDLGKDYEGYDEYLVTMDIEKGSLAATYNENGKLISVVENYKDVKLPSAVIYSVYKAYPGWTIVNDKYLYTQEEGDVIKNHYNLKIKKDNKTRKIVVNPDGEILKGI